MSDYQITQEPLTAVHKPHRYSIFIHETQWRRRSFSVPRIVRGEKTCREEQRRSTWIESSVPTSALSMTPSRYNQFKLCLYNLFISIQAIMECFRTWTLCAPVGFGSDSTFFFGKSELGGDCKDGWPSLKTSNYRL